MDEAAFIAADARVQQEVVYLQPGVLRRTTARGDNGDWLTETWWGSAEQADAARAAIAQHPAWTELLELIDHAHLRVRRYETLPG